MSDPMSERYTLSDEELEKLRQGAESAPVNDFKPVESVNPIDATDMACFSDIRKVLERHGKLERFGVTLLHKHFDLRPHEAFLETTDVAKRSMTVQPHIIDSSDINTIDTQWYLGKSIPLSVVKCRTNWHQ
jgi:hypothetical protein